MRKISKFLVLFITLTSALFLAACAEKIELSFESDSINMTVNDTETLTPIANKEGLVYVWTSDDEEVVTVVNGVLTAISAGTAKITVTVQDKEVTAEITVVVSAVTISLAEDTMTLAVDQEATLVPTVTPSQAMSYVWVSSDQTVATVINGIVRGIGVGTATITVSGKGGSDTISVTVVLPNPTKVAITNASVTAKAGETLQLGATVLPSKASQAVIWSSSDQSFATVSETGLVTFVGVGVVTITATSGVLETQFARVNIAILPPDPATITVTGAEGITEVNLTNTLQMSAVISPELADQGVTWSTSDNSVAYIDETGLLTAVKMGTVDVIATSIALGSVSGSLTITVVLPLPSSITLTGPETVIQIEENLQLNSVINPGLADQGVTYVSSDDTVATVDAAGNVVGIKAGTVLITATSSALNTLTSSFSIKVVEKVTAPVHPNIVIDSALATSERFSLVTYETIEYIVGVNAFADFGKVVAAIDAKIYVYPGNYSQALTINATGVQILGPNVGINPNDGVRNAEAIMSGIISVGVSMDGFMIDGLAFTGTGSVIGLGTIKNVTFQNNLVFDTTETITAWSASRNYALPSFLAFSKASNVMENIIIVNNMFDNVSDNVILLANILNATISGNTFLNFDRDAIRCDGGYNHGAFLISDNVFENDVLGAYNGIYVRSTGGAKDSVNPEIITISGNSFKNIGSLTNDFSGAITTNAYQENGLTIAVDHNVFETCSNYLWLRNNATEANHLAYAWVANVTNNVFLGVPATYYYRSLNTTGDTELTNPSLVNFDKNFFGDVEGNVITPDPAKLPSVKSITNNLGGAYEIDAFYVDPSLAGKASGEAVVVNSINLIYLTNAFSTITDALNAASDGQSIIVLPGTYAESFTVSKNGITLAGPNGQISPNGGTRVPEAILTGTITLGKELVDFEIRGFKFAENAQILNTIGTAGTAAAVKTNLNEFAFTKNFVESGLASGKGFIYFVEAANCYSHDLNFMDNYFTTTVLTTTLESVVYLDNNAGIKFVGNTFENVVLRAIYVNDMTKGLAGDSLFENNNFKNVGTDAIWINWLSPLPGMNATVAILGNNFETIGNRAIHVGKMNNADTYVAINIQRNTFNGVNVAMYFVRVSTGANLHVNYNKFVTIPTVYYIQNATDSTTSAPAILDAIKNLFLSEGVVVTPEAGKMAGSMNIAEAYASLEDYNAAIAALLG
jgi:uncharacterized protein YjdB